MMQEYNGHAQLRVDKMRLSTPYAGTGLSTIEREHVLAHAW